MTFFLQISQPYEKLRRIRRKTARKLGPCYNVRSAYVPAHTGFSCVFFFFNLFFYFSRRDPSVIKIVRLKLIE